MKRKKADAITKEQRIELVYRLILDGWNINQILQNTSDWGLTPRQIRHYVKLARERIRALSDIERSALLAEHIAYRRQLRRESQTVKEKLAVARDEAELLGLYPPRKTEISGNESGPIAIRLHWGDIDNDNGD